MVSLLAQLLEKAFGIGIQKWGNGIT